MKVIKMALAFAVLCLTCFIAGAQWTLTSPEGQIVFQLKLDGTALSYNIFGKKGTKKIEVIEQSSLGITRADQAFNDLKFISKDPDKIISEKYELIAGKRRVNDNYFRTSIFHFTNLKDSPLDLVVRVYNDGVAFKYVFPNKDKALYYVQKEATSFKFPTIATGWMTIYGEANDVAPAYENDYIKVSAGDSAKMPSGWSFPVLFKVSEYWALVTEANVKSNFYASHISQYAPNGNYTLEPPLKAEIRDSADVLGTSSLPWEMPWRVIIIGQSVGAIVESNLVFHVSDEAVASNLSWVKPGRASWAWWTGYIDGSVDSTEKLKRFIDFAKRMNWEYSLIDAGWENKKLVDIAAVIDYANEKNIKLMLWYNSSGPFNKVDAGPRDLMYDREIRRKEMKRISEMGIRGIKVDFFNSDKQAVMKLYHNILEDALEFKIMVNFHGCTLPKGWARTYPNLITQEAVKGCESYIWTANFDSIAPIHNSILPYTRNVVGSMDYTPVAFSKLKTARTTTYAHELALSIVFESGIIHFADVPEKYENLPAEAFNFLKHLPVAWDDTKYLYGFPGMEVVLARRSGSDWYIGAINGEGIKKKLDLKFSFLDNNQSYKGVMIYDGVQEDSLLSKSIKLKKNQSLKTELLINGGFVIKLSKARG